MKAEDTQALIKFCNTVVSDIKSDAVAHEDEIVMNTLRVFEVALAALSAQPIKLPKKEKALIGRDYLYVYCAGPVENAIRAAGYEVADCP